MLKGKTVIELTDVKTGQIEHYEDENIVTNALQDYISAYLAFQGIAAANAYMPLYNIAASGIKLFDSTIEENANNYKMPSVGQNKVVGYASRSQKTDADARRGNMNLQETVAIDNGMQLVWDFATSEANGTISSVCLTSQRGGQDSYLVSSSKDLYFRNPKSYTNVSGAEAKVFNNYAFILGWDEENNCVYTYKNGKVLKCKFTPDILKLNQSFLDCEVVETLGTYSIDNPISTRVIDENTLCHIKINYGGIIVTKYNIHTGAKTSNEYTISGALFLSNSVPCVVDGYAFIPHSGKKKMYKINLSNTSDVTLFDIKYKGVATTSEVLDTNVVQLANGDIACGFAVICPTNLESDCSFSMPSTYYPRGCVEYKGYNIKTRKSTGDMLYIGTNEWMLMTINNLQTPVTKTADKTMKITYTLLESE